MRRSIPSLLSILVLTSCSSSGADSSPGDTDAASVELRAGATFRGPLQGQDDLSGEVVIEVSASGDEITRLLVILDVSDYDCGDSTISGRVTGSASIDDGVPIVDGAFQDDSGTTNWQGSFKSDSLAEGTVQGTAAETCDWGPFPWTATTS